MMTDFGVSDELAKHKARERYRRSYACIDLSKGSDDKKDDKKDEKKDDTMSTTGAPKAATGAPAPATGGSPATGGKGGKGGHTWLDDKKDDKKDDDEGGERPFKRPKLEPSICTQAVAATKIQAHFKGFRSRILMQRWIYLADNVRSFRTMNSDLGAFIRLTPLNSIERPQVRIG